MMIGLLEGEYRIGLNNSAKSVQHAPQRGQVTLCNKIKETLDKLHSAGVIEPVSKPTPRISYMLAVENIRICHHLKDLNKAVLWENYPMPTIEDIATRLHGTKVFSVLDAKNGFWHVKLDEESSHLTTFHTPFGCYRWCRKPFGISLAPEVFQHRMHKLIEVLSSTEVVVILEGWPGNIHECNPVLRPFFQFREALIVQGNLVLRGPRLFVPSTLRKEVMSLAHTSHIGLGGVFHAFGSACSGPE